MPNLHKLYVATVLRNTVKSTKLFLWHQEWQEWWQLWYLLLH